MYVPGDDKKKIQKAIGLHVDCIALDCEDGVAINRKVNYITEYLKSKINLKSM